MNGTRLVRAAGAFGLASISAGVSLATRSGGPGGYLDLFAVVAVLLFVVGLAGRWPGAVTAAVIGLAGVQVLGHLRTDDAPELIAIVALLTGAFELGCWSMELAVRVTDRPGVHRARWAWVVGWTVGGGALAALVLGTATVRFSDRVPLDLLAVVAALLLLGAVAAAAVGPRSDASDR
ncbi:MAG: hypothetical protein JO291_03190 [Acidimicrobiia bacterium]|nr:hypothetical protein [Acidimicrobiia bacterium]